MLVGKHSHFKSLHALSLSHDATIDTEKYLFNLFLLNENCFVLPIASVKTKGSYQFMFNVVNICPTSISVSPTQIF